jgi:hypothetical protein
MSQLTPCSACQRHVRVGSPQCPFCGVNIVPASGALPRTTAPRAGLKRAAVFALSASVAVSACGSESDSGDDNSASPAKQGDTSASASTSPDGTGTGDGGPEATPNPSMKPVPDPGTTCEPFVSSNVTVVALYGAPVPPDSAFPPDQPPAAEDAGAGGFDAEGEGGARDIGEPGHGGAANAGSAGGTASGGMASGGTSSGGTSSGGTSSGGTSSGGTASGGTGGQDTRPPQIQPLYGAVPAPDDR